MWLAIACACYALTCVMIFDQNLFGTILFGCSSLCATWMAGAALRGSNTYNNETHNTYNTTTHNHVTNNMPSIYMPDGTLSPFATPEAIRKLHKQLGVPDKLAPVTIYVDREYRVVERPVRVGDQELLFKATDYDAALDQINLGLPPPQPQQQEEFRGSLVPVKKEEHQKALPPPKKRSIAVALVMGPKKSK